MGCDSAADGRGVVQIRFADLQEAYYRTCDDGVEASYRADLLAYHIDRLLALNRVPATAMRVVTDTEVSRRDRARRQPVLTSSSRRFAAHLATATCFAPCAPALPCRAPTYPDRRRCSVLTF